MAGQARDRLPIERDRGRSDAHAVGALVNSRLKNNMIFTVSKHEKHCFMLKNAEKTVEKLVKLSAGEKHEGS